MKKRISTPASEAEQPQPDSGHDEFNDARWWLTPEEEGAAEVRSMEIGEAIAARLRARLNVIDINDEELESWRLGKALAATVKPRPKT